MRFIIISNCSNLSVLRASFNSPITHSPNPYRVISNLPQTIKLDPLKITDDFFDFKDSLFFLLATSRTTWRYQYFSRIPGIIWSHPVCQTWCFVTRKRNWCWPSEIRKRIFSRVRDLMINGKLQNCPQNLARTKRSWQQDSLTAQFPLLKQYVILTFQTPCLFRFPTFFV